MTNQRIAITFLLSFSFFANYSHASESTVRCPDIETMHQSAYAISDAAFVNGNYMAVTQPYAIHYSDIDWFAIVYRIPADSVSDALEKARLAMQSISSISNVFADNLGGIFRCRYDYGRIETLSNDDDWRYFKTKWPFYSNLNQPSY